MKNILILLLIFFVIQIGFASDRLYQFVPAQYKGGEEALNKYIERKIKIKQFPDHNISNGRCSFSFLISAKGEIDRIGYSKKSDSCFFEKDLFGVFIWSEDWKPALFNDKPFDSYVEADVFFSYNNIEKKVRFKTTLNPIKEINFETNIYNEAVAMQQRGELKTAIALYEEAIEIIEKDSSALLNYGICSLKLNDTAKACNTWHKMKVYGFNIADKLINKYCMDYNDFNNFGETKTVYPDSDAMLVYISERVNYPKMELTNNIQGTVFLAANIDSNGVVKRVWIMRGVTGGPNLGLEATRILLAMPKWKSKTINGKNVEDLLMIPIKFSLK